MDVIEAIEIGREYVERIYGDAVTHIAVEEVEPPQGNTWSITFGFFHPWNRKPKSRQESLADAFFVMDSKHPGWSTRTFKTVRIHDETGEVKGMKHRAIPGVGHET